MGTKSLAIVAISAALLVSGLSSNKAEAVEAKDMIALRTAVMWSIASHFGQVKAAAAAGDAKTVETHAGAINGLAKTMLTMFPEGTGPAAGETRALDAIWTDWNGFVKAQETLVAESGKLVELAKSGAGADALTAQFGMTGKEGCGGCHKPFRAAKN